MHNSFLHIRLRRKIRLICGSVFIYFHDLAGECWHFSGPFPVGFVAAVKLSPAPQAGEKLWTTYSWCALMCTAPHITDKFQVC